MITRRIVAKLRAVWDVLGSSRTHRFLIPVALLVAAAGCAHQPDPSGSLSAGDLDLSGQLAGFFVGLFHGLTMVINLIASLFFDVRIYNFPNSGRLYDLGYVLGAAACFERTGKLAAKSVESKDVGFGVRSLVLDRAAKADCPACGHSWIPRRPETRLPL